MLLAQGPMGPAGGGFGREQGGQRSAMRGRAGMMGQLMAGYLGLTDAQKAQFKTIQQNARA
jgi:Spy/CpxP family protein refolding chaperone